MGKPKRKKENTEKSTPIRVILPKENQIIGIVEKRLGGNKMMISCLDEKSRNCRVPGRLKRYLWLRPGDIVIVQFWELDKNRGDIVLKYRKNQVNWLRKKGYLKQEKKEF
jgi:translation initiation factor 1A